MNAVVVLDLHGGLGALRRVRPFLYPLEGELCWLEPRSLREVPEDVTAWLRRHGAAGYRLIVLLGLEAPAGDPFEAALSLALHRLERHCLQPLRQARPAPAAIHAVVLDGLERDAATGCPLDPKARPGWELDTSGFSATAEPGGLLLGPEDPLRLARAFGSPVDLSGERNDVGLEGLSPGLRAELRDRLARVAGALEEMIESRLAAVRQTYPEPDHELRVLLEQAYAAIRRTAGEQLRSLEQAVPKLAGYRPDVELRRIVREHLGLVPAIRGLGLMRLPWQPVYGRMEPQALLALVDLILLLARRPCRGEDVDRLLQDDGRGYAVAVRFDAAALARLFEGWRGRLRQALDGLEQPPRAADPIPVKRFRADVCRITAAPPLPDTLDRHLGPWHPSWVRSVRAQGWAEWLDAAHGQVEERRRTVDAHLARLGERLRLSAPPYEIVEIGNLADERKNRLAELETRKAALGGNAPSAPEPLDRRARELSRRVLAQMALQPSPRELGAWLLAGPILLAAAWSAGPAVSVTALGPWDALLPGAVAVLALLAAAAPAWWLRRRIAGLARRCRECALDIDRELRDLAAYRCEQLERLCRLGMAARNRTELERLDTAQARKARLAGYHRRQLAGHLDTLVTLAGPGGTGTPVGNGPSALDPALPPARNRVYWPVVSELSGEKVVLAIGETHLPVEAPWVEAVEAFVLTPVPLDAFGREYFN